MSGYGEEIWKWDDCEKRLEFARQWTKEARPDSGDVRVDGLVGKAQFEAALDQADVWKRLYEAKSIECARLQKSLEKILNCKGLIQQQLDNLRKEVEELEGKG